jgi:hypothetical protein
MLYAECGDRLTDAGADRAKARALAAQPNFAVVGGNGGSCADRAKARALATQPNLAGVGNACGGRTDFHGVFQLMLLHSRLRQRRHQWRRFDATLCKEKASIVSGYCMTARPLAHEHRPRLCEVALHKTLKAVC